MYMNVTDETRSMMQSRDANAISCSTRLTAMPKIIKGAKIACLDFSLQKVKMKLGVQVLVSDPDKLEAIRQRLVAILLGQNQSQVTLI